MSQTLVFPILNKKVSLLPGTPIYFDDKIYLDKITDEEHSAFFRSAEDDVKSSIDINTTRCIKFNTTEDNIDLNQLKTSLSFCLNIFSDAPVLIAWAGHLQGEKKLTVKRLIQFESMSSVADLIKYHFKIYTGTKRSVIAQSYEVIKKALAGNNEALYTLQKYNSSLQRNEFIDKLVDSTISFESITPANTELSYRLSLYTAYITGETPERREEIFDKMRILYEVRSKIVHGDNTINHKLESIKANWTEYVNILKSAILYYLLFLNSRSKKDWESHLKKLLLGADKKITEK